MGRGYFESNYNRGINVNSIFQDAAIIGDTVQYGEGQCIQEGLSNPEAFAGVSGLTGTSQIQLSPYQEREFEGSKESDIAARPGVVGQYGQPNIHRISDFVWDDMVNDELTKQRDATAGVSLRKKRRPRSVTVAQQDRKTIQESSGPTNYAQHSPLNYYQMPVPEATQPVLQVAQQVPIPSAEPHSYHNTQSVLNARLATYYYDNLELFEQPMHRQSSAFQPSPYPYYMIRDPPATFDNYSPVMKDTLNVSKEHYVSNDPNVHRKSALPYGQNVRPSSNVQGQLRTQTLGSREKSSSSSSNSSPLYCHNRPRLPTPHPIDQEPEDATFVLPTSPQRHSQRNVRPSPASIITNQGPSTAIRQKCGPGVPVGLNNPFGVSLSNIEFPERIPTPAPSLSNQEPTFFAQQFGPGIAVGLYNPFNVDLSKIEFPERIPTPPPESPFEFGNIELPPISDSDQPQLYLPEQNVTVNTQNAESGANMQQSLNTNRYSETVQPSEEEEEEEEYTESPGLYDKGFLGIAIANPMKRWLWRNRLNPRTLSFERSVGGEDASDIVIESPNCGTLNDDNVRVGSDEVLRIPSEDSARSDDTECLHKTRNITPKPSPFLTPKRINEPDPKYLVENVCGKYEVTPKPSPILTPKRRKDKGESYSTECLHKNYEVTPKPSPFLTPRSHVVSRSRKTNTGGNEDDIITEENERNISLQPAHSVPQRIISKPQMVRLPIRNKQENINVPGKTVVGQKERRKPLFNKDKKYTDNLPPRKTAFGAIPAYLKALRKKDIVAKPIQKDTTQTLVTKMNVQLRKTSKQTTNTLRPQRGVSTHCRKPKDNVAENITDAPALAVDSSALCAGRNLPVLSVKPSNRGKSRLNTCGIPLHHKDVRPQKIVVRPVDQTTRPLSADVARIPGYRITNIDDRPSRPIKVVSIISEVRSSKLPTTNTDGTGTTTFRRTEVQQHQVTSNLGNRVQQPVSVALPYQTDKYVSRAATVGKGQRLPSKYGKAGLRVPSVNQNQPAVRQNVVVVKRPTVRQSPSTRTSPDGYVELPLRTNDAQQGPPCRHSPIDETATGPSVIRVQRVSTGPACMIQAERTGRLLKRPANVKLVRTKRKEARPRPPWRAR